MPRWFVFATMLLLAGAARAGMPTDLALPLDCTPGASCWVLRYVDHDPGPGAQDYACGPVTGDGHKGTDFALRDLSVMAEGVLVRAAAAGVVDALRDGVPDVSVEAGGREAIAGKECGNGIRIAHGDGWSTWYCHLRRGSLMVAEGDPVEVGQPLALVGLSGETSFPHLHFDVRHGEQPVDPFVGAERSDPCGPGPAPLWRADVMAALDYQPVVLTNAGVATAAPQLDDVERGWHQLASLPVTAPALVLWVEGYWLEAGDRVRLALAGPDGGAVVDRTVEVDKAWPHWFQFAGAKRPGATWPPGTYTGEVTLERAGIAPVAIRHTIELRAR
jgi:Peptidase family M23